MKNVETPTPHVDVVDGVLLQDPKDKPSLVNAWNISFFGAVAALTLLCVFQPDPYVDILEFLPDGILVTFEITVMSMCCTLPIGLFAGLGRISGNRCLNLVASTYVEVVRGIPLLVQLFYIYYAIGKLVTLPPSICAVTAISFCYGAYMGEVVRAGILAVPRGQTEAARSLGFTGGQTMRWVILPQALRTILPPIGNEFIAMLKDTSLVSIIAVADLLRRGREFAAQTFDYFETYTVVALVYLIITLLLSRGVGLIEGRMRYYDRPSK